MKIDKIRNIKIKDSRLIIIVVILAVWAVIALVNNFKILTDIFKTDEVEKQIINNYIEDSEQKNHITENVLTN